MCIVFLYKTDFESLTTARCQGHWIERKGRKNNSGRGKVAPKGCLAVHIGEEEKRFIVPIDYLYHPSFTQLLEEAKEVYGFDQKGPLRIPCDVHRFEQVLRVIKKEKQNA